MPDGASRKLASAYLTAIALIDQFSASLSVQDSSTTFPTIDQTHPSPLPLLSASAVSLKSQVTKLSLLTITPPFTPSAITTVLTACNDSVLPSLLTATLLITDHGFTKAYSAEVKSLVKVALRDLKALLTCVKTRETDGIPRGEPDEKDKGAVTEATGKVWEDCDELENLAKGGIGVFVAGKAQQWLALMQDAVAELKEWDPDEDEEDLFGEEPEPDSDSDDGEEGSEAKKKAASQTQEIALKVLTRIPQSIHVVIKQRLHKGFPGSPSEKQRVTVDLVMERVRTISDCVDETAEALYMGDHQLCLRKVVEARTLTIEVVESVFLPWNDIAGQPETREDKYIQRALEWIKQVEVESRSTANINGAKADGD